jgi:hypothetical protein
MADRASRIATSKNDQGPAGVGVGVVFWSVCFPIHPQMPKTIGVSRSAIIVRSRIFFFVFIESSWAPKQQRTRDLLTIEESQFHCEDWPIIVFHTRQERDVAMFLGKRPTQCGVSLLDLRGRVRRRIPFAPCVRTVVRTRISEFFATPGKDFRRNR